MRYLLACLLFPSLLWAQTVPVMAPNAFNEKDVTLDLTQAVRRAGPSFAGLRFKAKSGFGGVVVSLMVNNEVVSGVTIETDPAMLSYADPTTYMNYEIKNIEPVTVNSAALLIKNATQLKMQSLEVILGAPQEPVVIGQYPAIVEEPQVPQTRTTLPPPTSPTLPQNRGAGGGIAIAPLPPPTPAPVVTTTTMSPTTTTTQSPVQQRKPWWRIGGENGRTETTTTTQPPRRCSRNKRDEMICVGDAVKSRIGAIGTVLEVKAEGRKIMLTIDFDGRVETRNIDEVRSAY